MFVVYFAMDGAQRDIHVPNPLPKAGGLMNPMTNAHRLYSEFKQSVWLDYFDPNLLNNGGLDALMLDGVRGAINNPMVFRDTISDGSTYDETIVDLVQSDATIDNETLYQWIITNYAIAAADILKPVYESSGGNDGFVNVELSAHLAYDTQATIEAARHLWKRIKRKNLMIKVPATKQGIDALETLIAEGINVDMTQLYFLEDYKNVARSYLRGLARNPDPLQVRSVASYYLDSLDKVIDSELEQLGISEVQVIKGKAAVSGARIAYEYYQQLLQSDEFKTQQQRGACMQRLLWADTSPSNAQYEETYYVEQLIGSDTISAMKPDTFDAFILNGDLLHTLDNDIEAAKRIPQVLESLEIDLPTVTAQLQEQGVEQLSDAHRLIFAALDKKRLRLAKEYA